MNATIGATMKGYVNVTAGDGEALKIALAKNGPISVSIDASHRSFVFYADGVYYEPKCGEYSSGPTRNVQSYKNFSLFGLLT